MMSSTQNMGEVGFRDIISWVTDFFKKHAGFFLKIFDATTERSKRYFGNVAKRFEESKDIKYALPGQRFTWTLSVPSSRLNESFYRSLNILLEQEPAIAKEEKLEKIRKTTEWLEKQTGTLHELYVCKNVADESKKIHKIAPVEITTPPPLVNEKINELLHDFRDRIKTEAVQKALERAKKASEISSGVIMGALEKQEARVIKYGWMRQEAMRTKGEEKVDVQFIVEKIGLNEEIASKWSLKLYGRGTQTATLYVGTMRSLVAAVDPKWEKRYYEEIESDPNIGGAIKKYNAYGAIDKAITSMLVNPDKQTITQKFVDKMQYLYELLDEKHKDKIDKFIEILKQMLTLKNEKGKPMSVKFSYISKEPTVIAVQKEIIAVRNEIHKVKYEDVSKWRRITGERYVAILNDMLKENREKFVSVLLDKLGFSDLETHFILLLAGKVAKKDAPKTKGKTTEKEWKIDVFTKHPELDLSNIKATLLINKKGEYTGSNIQIINAKTSEPLLQITLDQAVRLLGRVPIKQYKTQAEKEPLRGEI